MQPHEGAKCGARQVREAIRRRMRGPAGMEICRVDVLGISCRDEFEAAEQAVLQTR